MSDTPATEAPEDAERAPEPERVHGCLVSWSRDQQVLHPSSEQYIPLMKALLDDGYELCVDLCGVDHLLNAARSLPEGVEPHRFEVVVNLVRMEPVSRIRVRVPVPEAEPVLPSLFDLWPGTEAMEREAFDMFGIRFDGHPDLTRILMPEDWIGYPLRKDYDSGRIPVQFKGAPEAR